MAFTELQPPERATADKADVVFAVGTGRGSGRGSHLRPRLVLRPAALTALGLEPAGRVRVLWGDGESRGRVRVVVAADGPFRLRRRMNGTASIELGDVDDVRAHPMKGLACDSAMVAADTLEVTLPPQVLLPAAAAARAGPPTQAQGPARRDVTASLLGDPAPGRRKG